MMKYEDMVYRCPGPYAREGGTYDTKGVNSVEEHQAALKDGWFNTLPEAIEGKATEVLVEAPPTRAELEQKARELNIKFNDKTTDAALAKKINDVLGV